jgi:hypothetical protein
MILGHIALSALLHRYAKADLVPVMAGGLFPDVVDKTLCQVLRLAPSGRIYAHTLLGAGISTLLVRIVWGRRAAGSWLLGYLAHLVADTGGPVPWFYPFVQYDFTGMAPTISDILLRALRDRKALSVESALLVWAVIALLQPTAHGT